MLWLIWYDVQLVNKVRKMSQNYEKWFIKCHKKQQPCIIIKPLLLIII